MKALDNYRYNDAANRTTDAGDLQMAIWAYMGQRLPSELAAGSKAKAWYDEASGKWANTGSVYVMQLYDAQKADHQDWLVEVVPEPGSIVLLACGALGALPLLRRRRAV